MASLEPAVTETKPIIDGYSPSKASFAKFLVRSLTLKDIQKIPRDKLPQWLVDPKEERADNLPARATNPMGEAVDPKKLKIGIIGAGIAGLYTALVLQDLGIEYEILEANPDRVGGRLYTHYFGDRKDETYQYYDIGAMRFPKSPVMERTFQLFKKTDTQLGDYIMSCEGEPMRYNDRTRIISGDKKWLSDPFGVSITNKGPVPDQTVKYPDQILEDAYYPYRRKIKRALDAVVTHYKTPHDERDDEWSATETILLDKLQRAWDYLMQHDKFSLRDYLSFVENTDDESIHWLETLGAGTGWFDQAFSENVLESLAFEYNSKKEAENNGDPWKPEDEIKWHYIKNGTYKLTENVCKKLDKQPEMGKMVTKMSLVAMDHTTDKAGDENDHRVQVFIRGEKEPRIYDTVFNTTTFAALQKMDLTGMRLPYAMKAAIRSLRYDPSTKVAIQFKEPWWIKSDAVKAAGGITGIKGGLGRTDMPLRTCVYPSYNLDGESKKTADGKAVLLCSYTWSSDSERIASMINPVSTKGTGSDVKATAEQVVAQQETILKETMIDNLARLHSTDDALDTSYQKMKEIISELYITHHAYDWSKDPYTCGGAFALYSPSQFRNMYPAIVRPAADSRLHIIGEAASAHHAWIVGALDSSMRGLKLMFERFRLYDKQAELKKKWGDVGEVDDDTAYLQVALGMVSRKLLV